MRQSLLVAAACLAADTLEFVVGGDGPGGWRWWAALTMIVLADAALATAARLSGAVAVLAAAVRVLSPLLLGGTAAPDANEAGSLIAGYRAGAWLRGPQAVGSVVVLCAGIAGSALLVGDHPGWLTPLDALSSGVLPWLVGRYTTSRRAYLDDLRRRAEQERRDARDAVAEAVARERSVIARDLHDVIAHHVSAINVHAGAARLGLGAASAAGTGDSLRAVETASQAAMTDLRRLLDVLHGDPQDSARQPGLSNLDELVDVVRAAGVPVSVHITGAVRPLPDYLDVALYRVVQEMLTNALRHGDGSGVEVTVDHGLTELIVTADNRIGAAAVPGGDHGVPRGLTGIHNRVRTFAGRAECGPRADGCTWRTSVAVPWDAAA
ncbi:sensor histidine kinase [Dactylosporangium sp. CA-092794]|uniref:sensor histidine kinase n=1 Tax=Dactylosporangium sp. CA-092794 TaxID=3239929 RepID=UPI003D9256E0